MDILKGTETLLIVAVIACIIVFVAMLIDLASGLHKAKQRGEIRSSYGLKRSIGKFIMYEGGMLIACGIDVLMHFCKLLNIVHLSALYGIPVITCLIGIFLLIIEIVSVFEKADDKTKTEISRVEKFALSMSKHEDILKAIFEYIKTSESNKTNGNTSTN